MSPMRSFDPRLLGERECATWVAYYRRDWINFLRAAVAVTRHAFGLPWPAAVYGAWLVLRANQLWAPYPDNDPHGARRHMQRFYRLVAERHGEAFDTVRAAELEVEWWRLHRAGQHADEEPDAGPLIDALTALYAHVYGVPAANVRPAARERALAMRHSDRWVREGCELESELIGAERAALVRSYAALLAAVHVAGEGALALDPPPESGRRRQDGERRAAHAGGDQRCHGREHPGREPGDR